MEKIYFAIFKVSAKEGRKPKTAIDGYEYYIMANPDRSVRAFHSKCEALEFFEEGYNHAHDVSFTQSMSACLNAIQFQPAVCSVKDIEELKDHVAAVEPCVVSLHCVSGHEIGITTRSEAAEYWERGEIPALIK